MTVTQLRYAITVAKAGSINRAAQELLIAQPNLSRAIRELERTLGFSLFERSSQGMRPTAEGKAFLSDAQALLDQFDALEAKYTGGSGKNRFSISVPRASYISDAFTRFSDRLKEGGTELFYNETNARAAVENIQKNGYDLGIIRYADEYEPNFRAFLEENRLTGETLVSFSFGLIMSRRNPLADKQTLVLADLSGLTEIAHADHFVPNLDPDEVMKRELLPTDGRRVFVCERASQFELLGNDPSTYMWVSPIPEQVLARYQLVQRQCTDNHRIYHDILIYRRDHVPGTLERMFIQELYENRDRFFPAV